MAATPGLTARELARRGEPHGVADLFSSEQSGRAILGETFDGSFYKP